MPKGLALIKILTWNRIQKNTPISFKFNSINFYGLLLLWINFHHKTFNECMSLPYKVLLFMGIPYMVWYSNNGSTWSKNVLRYEDSIFTGKLTYMRRDSKNCSIRSNLKFLDVDYLWEWVKSVKRHTYSTTVQFFFFFYRNLQHT